MLKFILGAHYVGPILLDRVKCGGQEKALSVCSYAIGNGTLSNHSSDAGVDCIGKYAELLCS